MLTPLSVVPSRQNPSTFSDDMDAFLNWLILVYLPWANSIENSFQFTATNGTSTTSLAITTGSKSLTTQINKAWAVGSYVYLVNSSDVTKLMVGQVTAYNNGTGALTVNVTTTLGSGTYATWSIGLAVPDVAALNLSGGGAGTIPYQSAASTTEQLAAGAANAVLQSNGAAAPAWVAPQALVASADAAGANNLPRLSQVATLIAVAATTSQRGTVVLASSAEAIAGTDTAKPITPATLQAGKMVSSSAVDTTSGVSVDFTGIPSWVRRITLLFNGVSTNGTANLLVQIGSGSFATSGYASAGDNGVAAFNSSAGFAIQTGAAAYTVSGALHVILLGSNTYVSDHTLGRTDSPLASRGGGSVALAGAMDRLRLTTVGGTDTFDTGSVSILWE